MRDLNNVEVRSVAGGIYQGEPDTPGSAHRNPLYLYLNTNTDASQATSKIVVEFH